MTLIHLPGMKLVNVANAREHHYARAARVKPVRQRVAQEVRKALKLGNSFDPERAAAFLPAIITVTRVAPRKLDSHDGLRDACKNVIDGIADALIGKLTRIEFKKGRKAGHAITRVTSNDSDPRLTFRCNQINGDDACLVRVEPRTDTGAEMVPDSYLHVFADGDSACFDMQLSEVPRRGLVVTWASPSQLRAHVTQCEAVLAELEVLELQRELAGKRGAA